MSAVINTNIAAIRTHNVYNKNNDYMNQALTRVSTGMKINSAKDGGSIWSISEKMRERIRANDQANQNVQNDTAMLKTAEGGISNTIDILKTLKERAVNAANDSNLNSDRAVIQQEIDELIKQINDNATKVKFNGRTLLNGAADSDSAPAASTSTDTWPKTDTTGVTAAIEVEPTSSTTAADHSVFSVAAFLKSDGDPASPSAIPAGNGTKLTELTDSSVASLGIQDGDKITITWKEDGSDDEKSMSFDVTSTSDLTAFTNDSNWTGDSGLHLQLGTGSAADIKYDGTNTATLTAGGNLQTGADKKLYIVGTGTARITSMSISVTNTTDVPNSQNDPTDTDPTHITKTTVSRNDAQTAFTPTAYAAAPEAVAPAPGQGGGGNNNTNLPTALTYSNELTFHIGGEKDFSIGMKFAKLDDEGLGIKGLSVASQGAANSAIEAIDNALNLALKEQTRIGAYENRLGYTSDNLTTMNENLEAADSVMRDSDIAKEMTQYMKYSVLAQASQYMLAQAGQNAFSVLNLLQA